MKRMQGRSSKARDDDRRFPIRVRVRVPELGFGRKLDQLYAWLDDLAGKGCYAIHSDTLPGIDAMAIYLEEPELVRVMVETFELELAPYKP